MRKVFLPTVLIVAITLLACSSIHIKTGPPTDAELSQGSEDRGRDLRIRWSDQLQQASPVQQAAMMRNMLDSTTSQFVRFGYNVLDLWRTENNRRGSQLTAAEMRTGIEQANQYDLPLLEAYEDILEFGIELLVSSKHFDSPVIDRFMDYRNLYYEVHSQVFYPNGGIQDYEAQLQVREQEIKQASETLAEELSRY